MIQTTTNTKNFGAINPTNPSQNNESPSYSQNTSLSLWVYSWGGRQTSSGLMSGTIHSRSSRALPNGGCQAHNETHTQTKKKEVSRGRISPYNTFVQMGRTVVPRPRSSQYRANHPRKRKTLDNKTTPPCHIDSTATSQKHDKIYDHIPCVGYRKRKPASLSKVPKTSSGVQV